MELDKIIFSITLSVLTISSNVTSQRPPGPQLKCRGMNELFYSCIFACGDGCDNYRIGRICTQECLSGACSCRRNDYFRHPVTGDCVYKDNCPTTSEYDYKNRTSTPPTITINSPTTLSPSIPKCNGTNEEYTNCGSNCRGSCRFVRDTNLACPTVCGAGCFCKSGYYRHPKTGVCVPKLSCPTTSEWDYEYNRPPIPTNPPEQQCTGVNEQYNSCGSGCGDDCRTFRIPVLYCPAICKLGCLCKPEHFRHPVTKQCIPGEKCPTTGVWDYEHNQPVTMVCGGQNEEYRVNGSGCGDGK